jgi:hypothetical protein
MKLEFRKQFLANLNGIKNKHLAKEPGAPKKGSEPLRA